MPDVPVSCLWIQSAHIQHIAVNQILLKNITQKLLSQMKQWREKWNKHILYYEAFIHRLIYTRLCTGKVNEPQSLFPFPSAALSTNADTMMTQWSPLLVSLRQSTINLHSITDNHHNHNNQPKCSSVQTAQDIKVIKITFNKGPQLKI